MDTRDASPRLDVIGEEGARSLALAILDTAVDGIVTIDERGRIELFNPAAERMFGYTAAEVCGQNVQVLMPPDYRGAHQRSLTRYLATGQRSILGAGRELVGLRRDGSTFPMEITVSEAEWSGHRVFAGIVRDLSEARRSLEANARLETAFLRAQKMEAVGRLAGGIAHDFNNLLMGVIGCCRIAEKELGDTHRARSLIEDVRAEAERAVGLTRQLLAFSRRAKTSRAPIELGRVVENARKMIGHLVGEDIAIAVRLCPSGGPVVADPAEVEQVLMNLVVNARDAMPRGGALTIETAEVAVDAAAPRAGLAPGRYVTLMVRDTGVGMDAATQARAFEPFFTTKKVGEGTGLGLSTAYGIVQRLQGHIEVESAPKEGATFTVWVPRNEAVPHPEAATEPPAGPERGEGTVLVVEDESLVRAAVRFALETRGYRVLSARDGVEALRIAEQHPEPIDVLLTDIVLPGLSGPELARRLAAARPAVARLFMSAYPNDYLVEQGRLSAGQVSLEKPFTEEELARSVRDALAARRS